MDYINAQKAAYENGLYLKMVVSVKNFDSYNSFFNIYGESEEPCRRIVIITKNEMIEEVYENGKEEENITDAKIVDGNIWIKDYTLLNNPEKIDLSNLKVPKNIVEEFMKK
ncbi:hypothetical protein [Clostridium sp. BJN0001]|uniref:hypothetical protein n=1 Tax=Clostridium sp. BJN0001 TaxID=2930219 RepID=UPI001FCF82BE|nr:hypothetical protein [Clostridium sp. BJN0001]